MLVGNGARFPARLAGGGIERLEIAAAVMREEYEDFLETVLARLAFTAVETAVARPERPSGIRFGTIGVRGMSTERVQEAPTTATIAYTLKEEAEAVRWLHREVEDHATLPLLEAEAVVRIFERVIDEARRAERIAASRRSGVTETGPEV